MTFGSSLAAAVSISRLISMANVGMTTDIKAKMEKRILIMFGAPGRRNAPIVYAPGLFARGAISCQPTAIIQDFAILSLYEAALGRFSAGLISPRWQVVQLTVGFSLLRFLMFLRRSPLIRPIIATMSR